MAGRINLRSFFLLVFFGFALGCKPGYESSSDSSSLSSPEPGNQTAPVAPPVAPPAAPPPPSGGASITHGQQLTAAMVGPLAIGISAFDKPVVGASLAIYNESSASFIKKIPSTATYDGFTIAGPHYLIEGVEINTAIDVFATLPLVIRGSRIAPVAGSGGNWGIHSRAGAAPLYVLYCDVGPKTAGVPTGELLWFDSAQSVAYRNHLFNISDDGIQVGGKNLQILENLLDTWTPAPGAHNDGIQFPGTADGTIIARNKILLNQGQTGTLNMVGWQGLTSNMTMDSNYLAGGGYSFYGSTGSGNVFTNNIFGNDFYPNVGMWGPTYPRSWSAGSIWQNNTLATGALVPAPL